MRDKEEETIKERELEVLGMCETRYEGEGIKRIHEDYVLIYIWVDQKREDSELPY